MIDKNDILEVKEEDPKDLDTICEECRKKHVQASNHLTFKHF